MFECPFYAQATIYFCFQCVLEPFLKKKQKKKQV